MSKSIHEIAEEVAYELQGSSQSLLAVLEQMEREDLELNQEFCDILDSLVFECINCNWWCEISEMTNDPVRDWQCQECAPDVEA